MCSSDLLRAVGVRRRRQEAPQDGAAPHGHLRWVRARARGAGRAAPARGGGDGELSRSPAGLLEQSHRVGPGAAAACPPRQCVWPSDRRLTEHKQSACRVGDLETKDFYPPRQILPHRRLPPIPPPLFSPVRPQRPLLSPVSQHPLLSLIHPCIRKSISPVHLLSQKNK